MAEHQSATPAAHMSADVTDASVSGPMRTADANRIFYADHAAVYDSHEHCVAHDGPRELLEGILIRAVAAGPSPKPRTLDACGGTGNVSELLAPRGIETTVADVSPAMLARWCEKAATLGVAAETIEGEIDAFLATDGRAWELIVFSSALHHLDNYVEVVGLAADRLAPGGVLVTAFDPIHTADSATHRLRRFDYLLSLVVEPRALAAALGRKLERRSEGGPNVGDLAEKHALKGIDDGLIAETLRARGLEILEHRRYACQRFRITERLIRAMRRTTTFHLIARKRRASPPTSTVSE
ncbi:MAG: class I SAM-dependent methyltransferase [Solirubrobacterales bacterium]|nr:class I SAM-dependent methyltransferase [Solirubrobacterales bacterium]